jgi:hypothetical protein
MAFVPIFQFGFPLVEYEIMNSEESKYNLFLGDMTPLRKTS